LFISLQSSSIGSMASAAQTTPDTPVTVKVNIGGVARRFKLPLRDVGINVLESKVSLWARWMSQNDADSVLDSCGMP